MLNYISKRRRLILEGLGDETVTNGEFTSDLSGWAVVGASPTWVWTSSNGQGVAFIFGTPTGVKELNQTITVEDGERYYVEVDMVKGTTSELQVNVDASTIISIASVEGKIKMSGEFVASGTTADLQIATVTDTSYVENINRISVKKINWK